MPKPDLLLASTDSVPKDRFFVASTKEPIDEGKILMAENADIAYCGGAGLADTWIGWGIVRMLIDTGKQAVLMFKPDQKFTLPGGQNEES